MLRRIGHYRITQKLGEGGMGEVFAAHDERLDRPVAIKMIRRGVPDASARERLWREARSAASVNHPNICQLYEVGEEEGELFIAMELLEGDSLAARLAKSPLSFSDAAQTTLGILAGLDPLHRRGLLHRDLKPANVFLTPHGVKLLDFGLALAVRETAEQETRLTIPGMVVGTPHYVAPEQLSGRPADPRSDLFAVGAILFEMLTGKQAFTGNSPMDVFHAVMHDEPPVLGGSAGVASLDRIIHHALAKDPEHRYPSAEAMANDLRAALLLGDTSSQMVPARPIRRLIVLPFRILRSDPETDFLAFSLPDAISSSLAGLDSLVVRSTLAAPRFQGETPDLGEIATKTDVDIVITGTLLRAGDHVRVNTQVVEVRGGALIWSQTSQVALGELFQLQDALTHRIVESLAVPLSVRDRRTLEQDVPANAQAYEYYLRANQLGHQSAQWLVVRDLYLRCLEHDPGYAPAWARLGRIYRVLGIFTGEDVPGNLQRAEHAFRRALEINPDLSLAHNLYTNLEVELGHAKEAVLRLLGRARARAGDAELFAGLVQACRYCGLLEASVAAHGLARRLDPNIRTSVNHAHLMLGDYPRSIETNVEDPPVVNALALDLMGRKDEAIDLLAGLEQKPMPGLVGMWIKALRSLLQDRGVEFRGLMDSLLESWHLRDPCALFYVARMLARAGDTSRALAKLRDVVGAGFWCFSFMARDPWLDRLRGHEDFRAILRLAEAGEREARTAFIAAGGEQILHLSRN